MSNLLSGIRFVPRSKDIADKSDSLSSDGSAGSRKKKKKKSEKKKKKRKEVLRFSSSKGSKSHSYSIDTVDVTSTDLFAELADSPKRKHFGERDFNAYVSSGSEDVDEKRAELRDESTPSNLKVDANQSVAALLRAKLKTTKGGLASADDSATGNAVVSVFQTNPYTIAKQLLAKRDSAKVLEPNQFKKPRVSSGEEGKSQSDSRLEVARMKADEKWNAESMDDTFVRNVLRLGEHYKGTELGDNFYNAGSTGLDEEDAVDMTLFQSRGDEIADSENANRNLKKAHSEKLKLESIISRCQMCIDNPRHQRGLTLSVGEFAYLRAKPSTSLHCSAYL
jgi:hypothetical protein